MLFFLLVAARYIFFCVLNVALLLANMILCVEYVERFDPFMIKGVVVEDYMTTLPPLHLGARKVTRRTTSTTTLFPPTTMYPHRLVEPTDDVCKNLNPPGYTESWTAGNLSRKLFDIDLRWKVFEKKLRIIVLAARIKGLYKGTLVQVRQNGRPVGTLSCDDHKNATVFSCRPGVNNTLYAASSSRIHFIILSVVWHVPADYRNTTDYIAHVTMIKKPGQFFKTETLVPKRYNPFRSLEDEINLMGTDSYDWGIIKMTTTKKPVYTKAPDDISVYKFWEKHYKHDSYLYYM